MKFVKGLIIGALVGFATGTAMTDRQRDTVLAAAKGKAAPVKEAIGKNIGQVADTVADEAVGKIDAAGDAVADTIASEPVSS